MRAFSLSLALCFSAISCALMAAPAQAGCVVLLHGLARSASSMDKMAGALKADGYEVVNLGYPSTSATVEELAQPAIDKALLQCKKNAPVNFVTHSMGGILLRYYQSQQAIAGLARTVMLGPPNKGSEVVDALRDLPGYALINGPAGRQLGTGDDSLPLALGAVDFEVGVVAGTSSINWILSQWLPNPDDGKVSVARTKVDGMREHIEVPVSHPFLMRDDEVINQTIAFLKHGQFEGADSD